MLSDNRFEYNEFDKFSNWIIEKFNQTVIAVKNDEIGNYNSNSSNKMYKILAIFKIIKNLLKNKNLQKLNL